MPQPAICASDLKKRYGEQTALDGLSLTVKQGEIYGLLGPNGAGKTTTLECIEGLRTPDSGSIAVLGMTQPDQGAAIRARIGVQLQSTGLFPGLTVRESIDLYRSFYPRPMDTRRVLELTGLTEKAKAMPGSLSGGWRQRVTLALALAGDPDILFLDEPTTGMDPHSRREVWDLIAGLRGEGRTVVLTTHSMEEAACLCDRVAIVDRGRIIAEGPPADLVRAHFAETAIEFAAPAGVSAALLADLPGVTRQVADGHATTLFSTAVPETVAALLALSRREGFALDRFTVRQATLEDLFLRLTGRRLEEAQKEVPQP